jgi:phospholipid/cholesterol/gamma-HCH transport system substrate-binding protein
MQTSPSRDLAVGLFVLFGLGAIAYLSLQVGGLSTEGGLELHATFSQIGGLAERSPVVISGVKVGKVTKIELSDDLRARVTLDVDKRLQLPTDTSASIRTAGLLGNQFIELEPGAEDQLLQEGNEITLTESALSIEKIVGSLVHNAGLGDAEDAPK